MTASVRYKPAPLALWLASTSSAVLGVTTAFAQTAPSSQPYVDPYRSGPTRPFDGSARQGVYGTQPAPSRAKAPSPYADTPRRDVGRYTSNPTPLAAIWGGLYVGAQAGYRWSHTAIRGSAFPDINTGGLQAGLHAGYNFQPTTNMVLGLETDVMLGSASGNAAVTGASLLMRESWTTTFRARAGYSFGNALVYGTGGVALAGNDVTASAGGFTGNLTDARLGAVFGVGIEYKIAPQMSLRLEGLRYQYRDTSTSVGVSSLPVHQSSNVLRAGLSYHFN